MTEPVEAQLARLDERLKNIADAINKEAKTASELREWLHKMDKSITSINNRVAVVESSLAKSAPTISEFVNLKHKIQGAGILGRWIWIIAAGMIGFLYGIKEKIFSFISGI